MKKNKPEQGAWGVLLFIQGDLESLSEKGTLKQRPVGSEEASHALIWGKSGKASAKAPRQLAICSLEAQCSCRKDTEGTVGEKKPETYKELDSYRALQTVSRVLVFTLSGLGNQWKILSNIICLISQNTFIALNVTDCREARVKAETPVKRRLLIIQVRNDGDLYLWLVARGQ